MIRVHKAPAATPSNKTKINLTHRDIEKIREFRLRRKYTDRAIRNFKNKKFSSNLSKTSDSMDCSMEIRDISEINDKNDLRKKRMINDR